MSTITARPPEDVLLANGPVQLAGTLYAPISERPAPALVIVHSASQGTRSDPAYAHLSTNLPRQGIAVFLYDRRGSGGSGGDFETADFDDLAGDALAAVEFLRGRKDIDGGKIGLYGISQGGWIAPLAAAHSAAIKVLIIVSGCGVSPAEQMQYGARTALERAGFAREDIERAIRLRSRLDEYYRGKLAREVVQVEIDKARAQPWFELAYLPGDGALPENPGRTKWYLELDYDPLPVWQKISQPALFIYAESDRWVPVEESMRRYRQATRHLPEVQFVRVEGTDHMMKELAGLGANVPTDQVSGKYIEIMVDWLKAHFG